MRPVGQCRDCPRNSERRATCHPDGFSESRNPRLNFEGCNLGKYGVAELFTEIRTVVGIFGVPDRAETLIAEMQARIDAVAEALESVEPKPIFIYNSGEGTPRAVLSNTMLSQVVELAGGTNILVTKTSATAAPRGSNWWSRRPSISLWSSPVRQAGRRWKALR